MYNFYSIDVYKTVIVIPTICNQFIIIEIIHENTLNVQQTKWPTLNNLI